jgi:hypothetical protein
MATVVSLADARRILGVADDAGADEVNAARRRLAKRSHPDVDGGDAETMRRLNEAAETLLQVLDATDVDVENDTTQPTVRREATRLRFDADVASFVIEALPVVAFEALLVVTSWIGEVVVDEPPYQLDVLLLDPLRCWCRLDLVPDAGSSTVSLTIAALPDEPLPDIDDVRDLWVHSLNHLGR